jgi:hypothetical protein
MSGFWDGQDCISLYEAIGHMDWAHKAGILLVKNSEGIVYLSANSPIKKDGKGNVIGNIKRDCLPDDVIASAKRFFEGRNEERQR